MDKDEYQMTQRMLFQVVKMSRGLKMREFLAAISHSETVAPMIDPTLYMKARDNLANIQAIAQAMSDFQRCTEVPFEKLEEACHGLEM